MWVWVVWEKCGKRVEKMWKKIMWGNYGKNVESNNMGKVWKICEKNSVEKMSKIIL
jgi:hypothetical protein